MRALRLMVEAFGPYKDKQTIDFSLLGNEAIYLITGPTGAGKTSIFDAICFALYGKASGSDRDYDTLRSDFAAANQTTEVAFTFELRQQTYQVIRRPKQLKAKERGDGLREYPATAELYKIEANERKLLHSKVNEVNETITALLALDYEQFCKMIMIPQGEFRKLIAENSRERELILQKIFHTYFYRNLTEQLKNKAKALKDQLYDLDMRIKTKLEQVNWSTDQQDQQTSWTFKDYFQALSNKLKDNNDWIVKQKKQLMAEQEKTAQLQEEYRQAQVLIDKFNEYDQLINQQQQLASQKIVIEQKQAKLKAAELANRLQPYEQQLREREKEWLSQKNELAVHEKELVGLKDRLAKLEQNFIKLKDDYPSKLDQQQALTKLNEQTQIWHQVIELDTVLAKLKSESLEKDLVIKQVELKLSEKEQQLKKIDEQLGQLFVLSEQIYQLKIDCQQAKDRLVVITELAESYQELQTLLQVYQKAEGDYNELKQKLATTNQQLKQWETDQQHHFAASLAKELMEDQPCPVCGSREHPYPADMIDSTLDPIEKDRLLNRIEQIEQKLKLQQDRLVEAKANHQAKQTQTERLSHRLNLTFNQLTDQLIKQQLDQAQASHQVKQEQLKQLTMQLTDLKQLELEKEKHKQALDELVVKKDEQYQSYQELNQKVLRLDGQKASLLPQLPKTSLTFEQWQIHLQVKQTNLANWFDDYKAQEEKILAIREQTSQLESRYLASLNFLEQLNERYDRAQQQFTRELAHSRFDDIDQYQKAKLSVERIQQLVEELDQFEQKKQEVGSRLNQLAEYLEQKQKPALDHIQQRLTEQQQQVDKLMRELNHAEHKLEHDQMIAEQVKELYRQYQSLDADFRDVSALADLAKGDNHLRLSFERYVLAAFLDEILLQANFRLDQLSDHRYQLLRSERLAKSGAQSGLDLEVLDQHTGKTRSVKTLSGGESFKASLSLALGMADVVQSHSGGVQLDTLFIDEGFGTLDDLSLEQAIDTLKGLQQNNRILGIISHVPQLKEEIHVKLQITSSPNGSTAKFNL